MPIRFYWIRKGDYKGCWGITFFNRWSLRHNSFIESGGRYTFFIWEDMNDYKEDPA